MKLYEFLKVCGREEYIGIWLIYPSADIKYNSKRPFGKRPTQQQYYKIGNIPYGKIANYLDYDVLGVNHTEKGYLVRIFRREELNQRVYINDIAYKVAEAIKRN